ncbi:glycerophosphodiester phosphodiesterase family protein [Rhodoplanes roseus]|uniref:Glycerophosphodiester phosphodiesterase n=1 Tax=Rhodoplanes roseus TaxID=29409 RepID=A0A327LCT9_9BRAD|nr:glycerophosphodiester phosphodiesterase family protein [Rhodoplanes roseus]RAI45618.1 glycerophosphodiester phosphodiesterase [Rhodoplanes roseus]
MGALAWLMAKPIAHRGLHDADRGIVENTAAAVTAAVEAGYGIEVDLQPSLDGEAMVHHDHALGRLAEGREALRTLSAADLKARRFLASSDGMLALGELLEVVRGRVPLLLELKSRFDGDTTVATRTAAVLAGIDAPVAVMSFDPALIVVIKTLAPRLARGVVGERRFAGLGPLDRRASAVFETVRADPGFVAWRLQDLGTWPPRTARLLGRPVLSWTIRSEAERQAALRAGAEQVIFEGFRA